MSKEIKVGDKVRYSPDVYGQCAWLFFLEMNALAPPFASFVQDIVDGMQPTGRVEGFDEHFGSVVARFLNERNGQIYVIHTTANELEVLS